MFSDLVSSGGSRILRGDADYNLPSPKVGVRGVTPGKFLLFFFAVGEF